MNSNDETCEDEWNELHSRFSKEGLDYSSLSMEQRILHVWRWLVDAESNLLSSRRMLDKLREQQHEELEEMESYIGHIRELAEKRTDHLESETISLRNKLHLTQQQTATLNNLLQRSGLEGLDGLGEESIGEQVAFLVADHLKLMEEVDVLKKIKFSNGVGKECELLSEMVKVTSEKEVLRREVGDATERLSLLEKASRQLQLDNERLAFKLSEALAELEEREAQLKQLGGSDHGGEGLMWISPQRSQQCGRSQSMYTGLCQREPSMSSLRTMTNEVSEDRESLPRNPSEASLLDHDQEPTPRLSRADTRSFGADSTPPSLLLSEPNTSCGSLRRISSLVDTQPVGNTSGPSADLCRLDEVKYLQVEYNALKEQHVALTEKYNTLVFRHIRNKTKRKSQLEELRRRMDTAASSSNCRIESLESQLALQKKALLGEEVFRKRVESDYRRLQEEKRSLVISVLNAESSLRAKEREILTLKKKEEFLEGTTADLLARVLTLKYTKSPSDRPAAKPSFIQSSKTVPNISTVAKSSESPSERKSPLVIAKRHSVTSVTDLGTV
ncbi:putative leucine-rich repeat-containing protein DDB_G0290503 [Thrips palmi]|uniref:Leucine-rich repeat-containing protein DDB_G0290503 n=1 Tax=Thrips palmi TaxID=161013 RepID=A0A6P8Z471_THRPL|nr:putative leucine-rich repeat-containing protein DDB_G0290503 [Thrips palmi]